MERKAISKSVRFEVFKRDSFKCQYCGRSAPEIVLHVDHMDPVSGGGDNSILNLITSCEPCNLGKGAKRLDDSAAVKKSKAQIDELQERRDQLEMLMAWRLGLKDLKQEAIEKLKLYWADLCPGFIVNDAGEQSLKKYVRQFSVDEVIDAMDRACDSYLKFENGKPVSASVQRAFSSIAGICRVSRTAKDKPYIQELYYSRGILRKRLAYCDDRRAIEWMEAAISWGVTSDEIRECVLSVNSWTNFSYEIDDLIAKAKREGRHGS